eukprot:1286702-Ditylum_brightwellii.AAC.1
MQGATGPGGVDSIMWQDWFLCFGKASHRLRESVTALACWLANTHPAWAAYRAICPGVRPVRVGEILLHMLGKCIIAVCGDDVTTVCSTNQLCAGLKASIKGAIHDMHEMWQANDEEVSWGSATQM